MKASPTLLVRGDCVAETAMTFARQMTLRKNRQNEIAENLMDFLYNNWHFQTSIVKDPKCPSYGFWLAGQQTQTLKDTMGDGQCKNTTRSILSTMMKIINGTCKFSNWFLQNFRTFRKKRFFVRCPKWQRQLIKKPGTFDAGRKSIT